MNITKYTLTVAGAFAALVFAANATAQSAYADAQVPTSPQIHNQAIYQADQATEVIAAKAAAEPNEEVAIIGGNCTLGALCNTPDGIDQPEEEVAFWGTNCPAGAMCNAPDDIDQSEAEVAFWGTNCPPGAMCNTPDDAQDSNFPLDPSN